MRHVVLTALRTARQAGFEMVLSEDRLVQVNWPRDITDAELEAVFTYLTSQVCVDRDLRESGKCDQDGESVH